MFEPFSSLLRNFSKTYEVEAKLFVLRNLAKIKGHSKEERIDSLDNNQKRYTDIHFDLSDIPVLQIAQLYNYIFDFRLLDMVGVKQIQFVIKWPPFSRFRLADGTIVSTDILEQEYRLVIDVQNAVETYLATNDITKALSYYRGKYELRLTEDKVLVIELAGHKLAAYEPVMDTVMCLVPLTVLDIKYIDIVDVPIESNQLYSVFRTIPGEINILLYPEYFEHIQRPKLDIYNQIDEDAEPVYTLLAVTNMQETIIQPVFVNQPSITLAAYTKYWSNMLRKANAIPSTIVPANKALVTCFDWQHPDYVNFDKPVIVINIAHNLLLSTYDRAYCIIAYTNNKDWSNSLGQRIDILYETDNVPKWVIYMYDKDNRYKVYENVAEFVQSTLGQQAFGYTMRIEELIHPAHYVADFGYLGSLFA